MQVMQISKQKFHNWQKKFACKIVAYMSVTGNAGLNNKH